MFIIKRIIFKILGRIIPRNIGTQLKNFKILAIDFGQWRTIKEKSCIDREGNFIPWYTYPAIEFLKQFDFSEKSVFEWGSGNSSFFWSIRTKEVISVEDDKKWFDLINNNKLDNQKVILHERKDDYINSILDENKNFDIIIIDGKYRYESSKNAIKCIGKNGLIILDNSDWHPKIVKMLKNHNLIQIDFNGFGPINGYTWTTSIFLRRNFNFKVKYQLKPIGDLNIEGNE